MKTLILALLLSFANIANADYITKPGGASGVPYTGATQNVDLGAFDLAASQLGLNYATNSYYPAASFGGSPDRISVSSLTPTVNTISFWFRWTGGDQIALAFSGTDAYNGGAWQWGLYISSGVLNYIASAGNGGSGTASVTEGTWYNAVLIRDNGSGSSQLYLNNSLVDSGTHAASLTNTNLFIGGTEANYFQGDIQELMMFSTALPATGALSVASLYNSGAGYYGTGSEAHLVAAYHLNSNPNAYAGGQNGTWSGTSAYTTGIIVSGSTTGTDYFTYSVADGLQFNDIPIQTGTPIWQQIGGTGNPITQSDSTANVQFAQTIQDTSSITSIDPNYRTLTDSSGTPVMGWGGPGYVYLGPGGNAVNLMFTQPGTGITDNDPSALLSVDPNNRLLVFNDGTSPVVDWVNGILYYPGNPDASMMVWNQAGGVYFPNGIGDGTSNLSIDASNRILYTHSGGNALQWSDSGVELEAGVYSTAAGATIIGCENVQGVAFPNGVWSINNMALSMNSELNLLYQAIGGATAIDFSGNGYNSSAGLSFDGSNNSYFSHSINIEGGNGLYFDNLSQASYGNTTGSNSIQVAVMPQGLLLDSPNSENSLNWFTRKGYGPNGSTINLDWSSNSTLSAPVGLTTTQILNTASQTTINGSAGTVKCSEPEQGSSNKVVVCYLSGYTNSGTQNYTFPVAFATVNEVITPTISGVTPTLGLTTVSFAATTKTGLVEIHGY